SGGPARRAAGVVESVAFGGRLAHGRYALRVRLVSRLALLRFRRTSRVHQGLSVPEVIARVLREHGADVRLALVDPHPTREYCVQYRETDLELLRRLSAEEGLTLHVEDPEPGADRERIVIGDSPAAYQRIHGAPTLTVREGALDQALEHREGDVSRV